MNAKQFAPSTCRPGEQREAQPASNVVFAVGGRKTKDPCVRDELTMTTSRRAPARQDAGSCRLQPCSALVGFRSEDVTRGAPFIVPLARFARRFVSAPRCARTEDSQGDGDGRQRLKQSHGPGQGHGEGRSSSLLRNAICEARIFNARHQGGRSYGASCALALSIEKSDRML